MPPALTEEDRALLGGEAGPALAMAMRILITTADVLDAHQLLDITSAHIDGCLYHGRAGLDFARRMVEGGARVRVPTTLNVGSLDLLHPELYRGDGHDAAAARDLMGAYVQMGCRPTWTCAPYQLTQRPALGEQIAWAESNAIVFANSVLGARTERYGDFLDICAAVTGRAPAAGLHLDAARAATLVVELHDLEEALDADAAYPVLGHLLGKLAGTEVAALVGVPAGVTEDRLKALGAAAAASGSVAMFHAVGITPEAPDLESALQDRPPRRVIGIGPAQLEEAFGELSTAAGDEVSAVCLGTPHYSLGQLGSLVELLAGRPCRVPLYVNTGREVWAEACARGWDTLLGGSGVIVVTDTCTYVTPILAPEVRVVMTDSAKWGYYAPGNLGVEVLFGGTTDCVETAVAGRPVRSGIWV